MTDDDENGLGELERETDEALYITRLLIKMYLK